MINEVLTAFHINRRPVSANARSNREYMEQIATAARSNYSGLPVVEALYSRIIWIHKDRSSQGDVDNIAKRVHDALKGVIFADDRLITHTMAVRVDASVEYELVPDDAHPGGAAALVESLSDPRVRDVLYVEIGLQRDAKIRLGPIQ